MGVYEVGFVLIRCHIQKKLNLGGGIEATPLGATGFAGDIHTARRLLGSSGFNVNRGDLDNALQNFGDAGHATLLRMPKLDARTFSEAIELSEAPLDTSIGALAVITANPVVPLCAYARSSGDSGVKYFMPPDRKIYHATNISGFLDALPDIAAAAKVDSKLNVLLRLYRASLREADIDYQLLFGLILFDEASHTMEGHLGLRIRKFVEINGLSEVLNVVAHDCGLLIPPGKDMVDVIVKLRNAAAHNGTIDAASLKKFGADWVVPLIADKAKLHRAIGEAIRYMFCALVGHTREARATLVTGSLDLRFD